MGATYDYMFKLLLVGDEHVGKTSLLVRHTDKTFSSAYVATIGVDFRVDTLDIEGKKVKLQIWDTAGQERYRAITSAYYRGAVGVVLMYDVNNAESFERVEKWLQEIRQHANADVKIILVGNKADTTGPGTQAVPATRGQEAADRAGILFLETSAKDGTSTRLVFESLVGDIFTATRNRNIQTVPPDSPGPPPPAPQQSDGQQPAAPAGSNPAHYDITMKVVLLGDGGVGKSCLLSKYADDTFTSEYQPTIGLDFKLKTVEVNGKVVKLQLWDTTGQERFHAITTSTLSGSQGAFIVCDVTNQESFANAKTWLNDIKYGGDSIQTMLVGNKCDLAERSVDDDGARDIADRLELPYMAASAKDGSNVQKLVMTMVEKIMEKQRNNEMDVNYGRNHLAPARAPRRSSYCIII